MFLLRIRRTNAGFLNRCLHEGQFSPVSFIHSEKDLCSHSLSKDDNQVIGKMAESVFFA